MEWQGILHLHVLLPVLILGCYYLSSILKFLLNFNTSRGLSQSLLFLIHYGRLAVNSFFLFLVVRDVAKGWLPAHFTG